MKRSLILVLLSSYLLAGCVAVVLVTAAAAGLVVYDKRDIVTMEKDTRIFHQVHRALVNDPRFQHSHITMSSFNQVVLLVGQTPAASLRVLAEKIAQRTPYVKRVYNQITVSQPITLSERTQDSWITSQVRSLMLAQKGLESGSIRLVTENRVVYLMGVVSPEQANLAVNVARQVNGVQKVVKIFQYTAVLQK